MIVQGPVTIPPQYSPSRRINASQVRDTVEFTNQPHPDPVSAVPLGKRSSNFLDWLVCLIPFLFLITILICMCFVIGSRVQHFKPDEAHNTLQRFKDNLKLAPIVDIQLPTPSAVAAAAGPAAAEGTTGVGHHNLHSHFDAAPAAAAPKPGDCAVGFEKAQLGQWGGVNSGCVCEDGTTKDESDCQESQKCYKVSAQDPVPFKNWLKTELCVKRAPKWKWYAETCPTGQKQCGGNICVPTADTCPVSKLKKETAASATTIKIGENNYSIQHESSPPVVNFAAVPGLETNRECYNSAVNPEFQSKLSYSLARVPATGCGQYKALEQPDVVIDHAPVSKVHEDNGLKQKLEQIKFYDKAHQAEDLYQLESVLRINVKNDKKCTSVHPDQIDSMQDQASTLFGTEKGMSTTIFIIALIGIVIAVIGYLIRERVFGTFDMANHHLPKPLALIALIVAILCIILGAIYIHNVNGDDGLANNAAKVQQYNQDECFPDAGLKKAITDYGVFAKNTYTTTYSWIITAFALSIAFVVILILLVVMQHSKGLKALGNPWRDLTRDYQPYQ